MATTPQTKFTVTLPTQDNATPPNKLAAGDITSLVFTVTAGTVSADYSYTVPAGTAAGATVTAPFASLSPAFVPVANVPYSADVYAVDANGNGVATDPISWTQDAPVPAAPTGFTVG